MIARLRLALLLLCPLYLSLGVAPAHALRVAIVAGNNVGYGSDGNLRYAEADAGRIAKVLVELAGFPRDQALLLTGRSAADLRTAFSIAAERLKKAPGDHLFFFYYSGHADAQALHVGRDALSFSELKQLVTRLPAAARVVIVDACQSGALTRIKGGRPGVRFDLPAGAEPTRGLAILASASDTELAQESDELRGSFFTHHLDLGLRGLADRNRDGRVTLSESFDYASDRTLHATLSTSVGPQHPTFRYDLAGQRELVLTEPNATGPKQARLVFDKQGWYFVRSDRDTLVTETQANGGERVTLPPGRYEIARRDPGRLETASVTLASGSETRVSTLRTTTLSFGRAVRKGGGVRSESFAVSLGGSLRSSIASLGPAAGVGLAGRVDGGVGSLELRASLARSTTRTLLPSETWDTGVSLVPLRAFDFGTLTFGAGLELGYHVLHQEVAHAEPRVVHAAAVGPALLLELALSERFCVRADLAVPSYLLELESGGAEEFSFLPGVRAGFGAGSYF